MHSAWDIDYHTVVIFPFPNSACWNLPPSGLQGTHLIHRDADPMLCCTWIGMQIVSQTMAAFFNRVSSLMRDFLYLWTNRIDCWYVCIALNVQDYGIHWRPLNMLRSTWNTWAVKDHPLWIVGFWIPKQNAEISKQMFQWFIYFSKLCVHLRFSLK